MLLQEKLCSLKDTKGGADHLKLWRNHTAAATPGETSLFFFSPLLIFDQNSVRAGQGCDDTVQHCLQTNEVENRIIGVQ